MLLSIYIGPDPGADRRGTIEFPLRDYLRVGGEDLGTAQNYSWQRICNPRTGEDPSTAWVRRPAGENQRGRQNYFQI